MNCWKIILVILTMSIFSYLSCASKEIPATVSISPTSIQEEGKAIFREAWKDKWESSLAIAKKEGKLVVYSTHGAEVRAALVQAFKQKYGIDIDWTTGRPAELEAKFMSEKRAGINLVDVLFAGTTSPFELKHANVFKLSIEDQLILPEVTDPQQWYQGKFPWNNAEHSVISVSSMVYPFTARNTDLVKVDEISNLLDLLDPKWKRKIVMSDPTVSGSGATSFGMVGEYIMGWDYLQRLAKQEPFITRDTRLMVEWLAKGKYPLSWAPRPEPMNEFLNIKAPISYLDMKDSSYLTVGGSAFTLMKDNPHPNSSIVFANWLLTREGQTLFTRARGDQSFRLDVPVDHLPSILIRDPKKIYLRSDLQEVLAKKEAWREKGQEIFGSLLK